MEIYKGMTEESEEKNLFGKCEKTLEKIAEERIFDIYFNKERNVYRIYEKCDEYFCIDLTSEICEDLAELFTKIAKEIKEK